MTTKKQKVSVADRIMSVINETLNTAEEIKKNIKDQSGYVIKMDDIRVNLLYLLRREKIKRKRDGKIYKYCI